MIALDTSALVSIFRQEDDALTYERAIFHAGDAVVSAPTAFEFVMVAQGRHHPIPNAASDPWRLLSRPRISILPWLTDYLPIAHEAFRRFGKGQGHPAQLNFGDCMSYALAKALDVPLLFKGDDFGRTDIRPAV